MVIVESNQDFKTLMDHLMSYDVVLDIVPIDQDRHPCNNDISLIFFHFLHDSKQWCLPMMHNECFTDFGTLTKWYELFLITLNGPYSKKYVFDKKKCVQLLKYDYSFLDVNVWKYLEEGSIDDFDDVTTNAKTFIETTFRNQSNLNLSIPIFKHAGSFQEKISRFDFTTIQEKDRSFRFINDVALNRFAELESVGLFVDRNELRSNYGAEHEKDIDSSDRIYSQYNLYTSTGRPSNRHGGINYAAINKDSGTRKCFVSRFGADGMLIMIDYSAFHPRLIANLANYSIPIEVYPYEYLAKYFYGTETPTEEETKASKGFCFQLMYGGIPPEAMEIPYFKSTQHYIDHRWNFFQKNGYIETPVFNRRIKHCHIDDPSPNKLFNYILQAYETEIGVQTLDRVMKHVSAIKSRPVLYTYDSLLFDVHKDDGKRTIKELRDLMENRCFPVKVYAGKSYQDMVQIKI